jgi:hypothetical protein
VTAGGRKVKIGDRRRRSTFWLDDDFIDRWAPWLGGYPSGTAAIACYVALARHAGRDGESWPSVARLAASIGLKERAAQMALRLLEHAGLVVVYLSVDAETHKPRTNTYVLVTPPATFPELPRAAKDWPDLERRRVEVSGWGRDRAVVAWPEANERSEGRNICTPTPADNAPLPPQNMHPPRARPIHPKENLVEGPVSPAGEETETPAMKRWRERHGDEWRKAAGL